VQLYKLLKFSIYENPIILTDGGVLFFSNAQKKEPKKTLVTSPGYVSIVSTPTPPLLLFWYQPTAAGSSPAFQDDTISQTGQSRSGIILIPKQFLKRISRTNF